MASVRDVLSHAGKRIRLTDSGGGTREGLALRQGQVALIDPNLKPLVGERILFLETGEAFRISSLAMEDTRGKLDHYRAALGPDSTRG